MYETTQYRACTPLKDAVARAQEDANHGSQKHHSRAPNSYCASAIDEFKTATAKAAILLDLDTKACHSLTCTAISWFWGLRPLGKNQHETLPSPRRRLIASTGKDSASGTVWARYSPAKAHETTLRAQWLHNLATEDGLKQLARNTTSRTAAQAAHAHVFPYLFSTIYH